MKTIAEVIVVENSAPEAPAAEAAQAPNGQAAAANTPAAAPKTVSIGQTTDEVVSAFGQPQKIVNLGKKVMYFYPDMKVIFVDGKVSDVQ